MKMVTLITTSGSSSVDIYARKLAEHLDVPKLSTDVYPRSAGLFNSSFFCPVAIKASWRDWHFVRMLNKLDGIVHLPNQQMGRYGFFLKVPYIVTVHDLIMHFDLKRKTARIPIDITRDATQPQHRIVRVAKRRRVRISPKRPRITSPMPSLTQIRRRG